MLDVKPQLIAFLLGATVDDASAIIDFNIDDIVFHDNVKGDIII